MVEIGLIDSKKIAYKKFVGKIRRRNSTLHVETEDLDKYKKYKYKISHLFELCLK